MLEDDSCENTHEDSAASIIGGARSVRRNGFMVTIYNMDRKGKERLDNIAHKSQRGRGYMQFTTAGTVTGSN